MKNKILANLDQIYISKNIRKRLSLLFSDKFGLVNAILQRHDLQDFGWSMFQSLSARTSILFGLSRDVSSGGLGVDRDSAKALIKCFGESVERYCMSFVDDKKILRRKLKDLPPDQIIKKFHLYSKKQYKQYSKIFADPENEKIYWSRMSNFFDRNKYIYYPSSLIYLPFEKEKIVAEPSSTGVSAHFKIEDAVFGGILEIIERDAIMINHALSLRPDEIDLATINGKIVSALINKIKSNGYKMKIFKLKSDINIPIFQGFIWRGSGNKLHYGIGACASLNAEKAIEKVLQECLFTYRYSKNLLDLKQNKISKITKLYEHFLYYQGNEFKKLDIFKSKIIPFKNEKFTRGYLLKELNRNDLDPYYFDLTTPDVSTTGFKVVRVVIPGMIDINKTHLIQRQAAERFWLIPEKLGIKCKKRFLNPLPHPFP